MRVSIIIPLFNKAPFIARALASVAAQTFTDFEVIVVDDGSSDEGPQIVKAWQDFPIDLIVQENSGPGAARNRGLDRARGNLVAFLDADDEWLPGYLAQSISRLEEYGPQVGSITSGYIEDPAGVSREDFWRRRGLCAGVTRLAPDTRPDSVITLLAYMSPCTTVVRAEVARKWGGFYERDRCLYAEDAHLWLKVLLNESVAVNLEPLARIHFEASGPTQTRRAMRPIEPFLVYPEEIEAACAPSLRELLARVLAARALKTACVLGYWGRWREARDLVRRFRVAGEWRLPYYTSSLVCRTPLGGAIGRLWRMTVRRNGTDNRSA